MTDLRNPDVVPVSGGFKHLGKTNGAETPTGGQFFACYEIIETWTIETVREQLWKIGWPYERIIVRVLGWEEAVTRLKDDVKSMMAMTRMVVAIEDPQKRLYLVRTPDLVSGERGVHRRLRGDSVQRAVDSAFKKD